MDTGFYRFHTRVTFQILNFHFLDYFQIDTDITSRCLFKAYSDRRALAILFRFFPAFCEIFRFFPAICKFYWHNFQIIVCIRLDPSKNSILLRLNAYPVVVEVVN
jgi:hypothetical protein